MLEMIIKTANLQPKNHEDGDDVIIYVFLLCTLAIFVVSITHFGFHKLFAT